MIQCSNYNIRLITKVILFTIQNDEVLLLKYVALIDNIAWIEMEKWSSFNINNTVNKTNVFMKSKW